MIAQEKIKQAALKLMAHKGFNATTIDEIAEEAQIPLSDFYKLFNDKQEVISAIFRQELAKRQSFYLHLQNWHMDWFLKINGILNFHLKELQRNPALATVLFMEKTNPHLQNEQFIKDFTQPPLIFSEILEQALQEKKISPTNVPAISLIIQGFLETLTFEFIKNENKQPLETAIESFCLLLKNGLKNSTGELG